MVEIGEGCEFIPLSRRGCRVGDTDRSLPSWVSSYSNKEMGPNSIGGLNTAVAVKGEGGSRVSAPFEDGGEGMGGQGRWDFSSEQMDKAVVQLAEEGDELSTWRAVIGY